MAPAPPDAAAPPVAAWSELAPAPPDALWSELVFVEPPPSPVTLRRALPILDMMPLGLSALFALHYNRMLPQCFYRCHSFLNMFVKQI